MKPNNTMIQKAPNRKAIPPLVLLLTYAAMIALYMVMRYRGQWLENDTVVFVNTIRGTIEEGTLLLSKTDNYPHGYAFQALSAALLTLTGVSPLDLLTNVLPFAVIIVAIVVWVLLKELSDTPQTTALSVSLLFLQSHFLFSILRGNHEKLTLSIAILCAYVLARSFRLPQTSKNAPVYIIIFYGMAFTLVSTNIFFGSSFIVALALSLILGQMLNLYKKSDTLRYPLSRLTYTITSSIVLTFIVMLYLYPPSFQSVLTFRGIGEQIGSLLLGTEPATDPYNIPLQFVGSEIVYWTAQGISIIVLLLSGIEWLSRTRKIFSKHIPDLAISEWMGYLLYSAFAIQFVITWVADFTGLFGNLQIRILPALTIFATPLAAARITLWGKKLKSSNKVPRITYIVMTMLIIWFAFTSTLKAVNEPLTNNLWMFYTQSEVTMLSWHDQHQPYSRTWIGPNQRLRDVFKVHLERDSQSQNYYSSIANEATTHILITLINQDMSVRLGVPIPNTDTSHRVYDSGATTIYHRVPRTPFER